MAKKLIYIIGFVGTLFIFLVSVNSAVTFTATIVPTSSTVPCDVGPPYQGTIPRLAAVYGFTHCINYDFTQTQSFTSTFYYGMNNSATWQVPQPSTPGGVTYTWSNFNSWLSGGGATFPLMISSQGNIHEYAIVNDPVFGNKSLQSQYVVGDTGPTQINSIPYPSTNAFTELVVRFDPNHFYQNITSVNNGEIIDDFGFFFAAVSNTVTLATDDGTTCGSGTSPPNSSAKCTSGSTEIWSPPPACPGGFCGEPSVLVPTGISLIDGNYHTLSNLNAASRTTNLQVQCTYYDGQVGSFNYAPGTPGNCWQAVTLASSTPVNAPVCQLTGFSANIACYQSGIISLGNYVTGATQNSAIQYIKRLTIWTCPGWNTASTNPSAANTCDSNGVSGFPPGQGSVLAY